MISASVRSDVARLAAMRRASASAGEHEAAEVLAGMLRERGLAPVLERERATGGYWQTNGLAVSISALAGLLGRRRRLAAGLVAALAGALAADDVDNGRHLLRRLLPARQTTNVHASCGDPAGTETVLIVAHHDAAHSGLLFHPALPRLASRLAPGWYARQNTSVQTGRLIVLGPALVALGCAIGSRRIRSAGVVWSLGTAALLGDVARSPVTPGANDNLSAVGVLLGLTEQLAGERLDGVRVLLLSTGSEESFMEGMRGFIARHRSELDTERTRVIALECVGSPILCLLEGEGMLVMRDHDAALRAELASAAEAAGIALWRGLRLGAGGSDALPALRAGYRSACLAACTELKVPANYHSPEDLPENLRWETITSTSEVLLAHLRMLSAARAADAGSASPA